MLPQEYFTKARENKKIPIRKLAEKCNISPSIIVNLSSGKKDFRDLHFNTALNLFSLLEISIPEFFETFYPEILESVNLNIYEWEKNNKQELNYEVLKKRIYNRLFQNRHRDKLDYSVFYLLFDEYNTAFSNLLLRVDDKGYIDQASYDEFVSPLLSNIKSNIEKCDKSKIVCVNANYINDIVIKSKYSYMDIGSIIGISQRRLLMLRVSEDGFTSMKISNFLKLCYVLNIDFYDFVSNKI